MSKVSLPALHDAVGSRESGSTMPLRIKERAYVLACFDETKSLLHPPALNRSRTSFADPTPRTNQPGHGIHAADESDQSNVQVSRIKPSYRVSITMLVPPRWSAFAER